MRINIFGGNEYLFNNPILDGMLTGVLIVILGFVIYHLGYFMGCLSDKIKNKIDEL